MADVVIERCVLRIVRKGGWAWGPHPRGLAEHAIRALPSLLAGELAALLDDEKLRGDVEIGEPVTITIDVGRSGLSALIAGLDTASPRTSSLESATAAAGEASAAVVVPATNAAAQRSHMASGSAAIAEHASPGVSGATWRILRRWHADGVLADWLSQLDAEALESIERALLVETCAPSTDFDRRHAIEEIREALLALRPAPVHIDARRRWRIDLLMQLQARSATGSEQSSEIEHLFGALVAATEPDGSLHREESVVPDVSGARGNGLVVEQQAVLHAAGRASPALHGDVRIASALPFLMLRPLHRAGYWDVLRAQLEQHGGTSLARPFAAAMAYKALQPLGDGWRRSDQDRVAAAAFAGQLEPIADTDLHRLAYAWDRHTSLLDRFTTMALRAGHAPGPLWLTHDEGEYVLWEPDGRFPIVAVSAIGEIFSTLTQWQQPTVVSSIPPSDLRLLDRAGFRFFTTTAPGRRDRWFRAPGRRTWTNVATDRWPDVEAFAAGECRVVWSQLRSARLAFPLLRGCALERTVTLGTALALGSLAWDLWGTQEPTTPLMAIDRFGDFDALVSYSPERVRVRLPLGQRYLDLEKAGYLAPVRDLPWLPEGTVVEFARW
jgi:hypothetical protein